jgi:hypothetical protein
MQFVYPFTLEPHVLTMESSRRSTLLAHTTRWENYLRSREEDKERRKREALRRVAPGFEPQGGTLVPTQVGNSHAQKDSVPAALATPPARKERPKSVMDDLVDHLASLDTSNRNS